MYTVKARYPDGFTSVREAKTREGAENMAYVASTEGAIAIAIVAPDGRVICA